MRVCFVGSGLSFIERDKEILSENYTVDQHSYDSDYFGYIREIKQAAREADVVFGWFASWETLPAVWYARRYNVPSVVSIGGFDAAFIPRINYGAFTNFKERMAAKLVYRYADKLLTVDPSLKQQAEHLLHRSLDKMQYLPTGYDDNHFCPNGKKEDVVLTVGSVSPSNVARKGFQDFVEVARFFPNVEFVVVGEDTGGVDQLKEKAPDNVIFTGFVSDEKLLDWYQRAKVYCMLSRHEGLPNSLCEAMLCGCIPVGSYQNGIPRAIGNTGFFADYGDISAIRDAIYAALSYERGGQRDRIRRLFPVGRRKGILSDILEELL